MRIRFTSCLIKSLNENIANRLQFAKKISNIYSLPNKFETTQSSLSFQSNEYTYFIDYFGII